MFAVAPDEAIVVFRSFECDCCRVVVDEVESVVQVDEEAVVIDNGDCSLVLDVFASVFVLRNVNGEGIPEFKLVMDDFKGRVAALFKEVLEECKEFGLFVVTTEL